MFKEFKEFISKGNVLDMAIGVVIAGAFGAVISALVDNILMPIVGAVTAGIDFKKLTVNVLGVELGVGIFINALIVFLITAFFLFLIIKSFNKLKRKNEDEAPTLKECPHCKTEIHVDATRCPNCTSELTEQSL